MKNLTLLIKPASSLCNLCCKYCFYADVSDIREQKSYGIMSEDTVNILLDRVFETEAENVFFAFQGGEPTIAGVDFFTNFVRKTREKNTTNKKVHFSLQTNGTLLNEEFIRLFKKNSFLIGLSLDGYRDFHDTNRIYKNGKRTSSDVMKAARLLKKHCVDFNILSVISKQTCKETREIYEFFKKEKFRFLQFIPLIDDFNSDKKEFSLDVESYMYFLNTLFEMWYSDLKRNNYVSIRQFDNYISLLRGFNAENCAMNGFCSIYYVIEGDGSVFPCDFYCIDKWKLGNIKEHSFYFLESNETHKRFLEDSKRVHEKCSKCEYYFICRGGCKRDREPDLLTNKYCESYRNFFKKHLADLMTIARNMR